MKHCYRRKCTRNILLAIAALFVLMVVSIQIRLAIAYYQNPEPQAILMLGGDPGREKFTAQFAKFYPNLKIWVSSGTEYNKARLIFQDAGISDNRLHFDYQATDTLTNFTTTVEDFQQQEIRHIFLITSEFHIPRAKAIATFVLGSRGIAFTPVSVPSRTTESESLLRILRDIFRSLLWIVTGYTGT